MTRTSFLAAVLASSLAGSALAAPKLSKDGVVFDSGVAAGATLSYPMINGAKPSAVEVAGSIAKLQYKNGGAAEFSLSEEAVSFWFTAVPSDIKDYKFELQMPISLGAGGARWAIKDKSGAFPQDYGATKLYQGNAGNLALSAADGGAFAFKFPEDYAWVELQDLREWKTTKFSFTAVTPFNRDKKIMVVPFGSDSAKLDAAASKIISEFHAKNNGGSGGSGGGAGGGVAKPAAPVLSSKLTSDGVSISAGQMGAFSISYPKLNLGSDGEKAGPIETRVENDSSAKLKYKNGGEVSVKLSGGKFLFTFDAVPSGLKNFHNEMFIPFNYKDGGAWSTGDKSGAFPPQKVAGGKIYQGHSRKLVVTDVNKTSLAFEYPENTYFELQDNREWNWSIFYARNLVPFNPGIKTYSVNFSLDASSFEQAKLLDKFGQVPRDFPGKIKSDDDFAKLLADDEAYYKTLAEPRKLNRFGGLAGSGAKLGLKKTGFFYVTDLNKGKGKVAANSASAANNSEGIAERWILVDPEGDAFFHLGICAFGPGDDFTNVEGRRDAYTWLPPRDEKWGASWKEYDSNGWWSTRAVSFYIANVIRKYGKFDPTANAARMVDRVRAVGFNSIGAFSGADEKTSAMYREKNFPRVGSSLPYGKVRAVPGVRGVFDPFDADNIASIESNFAKLAKSADDPLIIGYFLENEQGFEDLARAVPALDKTYAAKRELVRQLEAKYGAIAAFNDAWKLDAPDFASLHDRGLPLNTKAAFADMQAYSEIFLEAYYKLIADNFRKHDKNHLLLGNRWQPRTANSEPLCRIAGKYMDIVSINYYASGIDKEFMTRLYNWSGKKPQFWSEFYFTATKESNCGASGHDLPTQRERGLGYRNYIEQGAALGFLVGTEWFTLIDQAATGRFFEGLNGERANTGLFNVSDQPYKAMFAEMRKSHDAIYDVWLDGAAPYAFDDPRFTQKGGATRTASAGRALSPIVIDGTQTGYPLRPPEMIPSSRLVSGREADGLEGAFKAAWDDENLYLLISVKDKTPMQNKQPPASLWNADCVELFIGSEKLDQGGTMLFTDRQLLLGAGESGQFHVPNVSAQPALKTSVTQEADGKGYVLEVAIPWQSLDIAPKENQTLLFDIGIDNSDTGSGRNAQLMWNGTGRNSGDRSAWGRLHLVR